MKKLYVGNISYKTSEETLRGAFAAYNSVTSVKIITDKFSKQSRGFGFVEFTDDAEALQAIEDINGIELEGKILKVNEARPQGSGGGRGGFNRGGGRGGNGGDRRNRPPRRNDGRGEGRGSPRQ